MKNGLTDMTEGSPLKHIIRFSIPLLIGNLFQQLYNVADTIIVGNVMEEEARKNAQAAVSNGAPVILLTTALFIGLGMGATIIISQNYGAKELQTVRRSVKTMYTIVLTVSIPLTVIGIFITPPLLRLLKVPDTTMDMAVSYISIIFVGTIGSLGYNINAGILQGLGDSKTPLRFLMVSTVVNIVLDLLFLVVFGWGVQGVAVATITAQAVSWLYGVWYIRKKYPELGLSLFKPGFDRDVLKKIVRVGLPSSIQQSLFSVGMLLLQNLVNRGGPAFIAGYGNAGRIDSFVFLPVFSFFAALTTFTGQNMGARRIDRVMKGLRASLAVSLGTYAVVASLTLFLGRFLLGLFNSDPEVVAHGLRYLYAVIPFSFIVIIQFMLVSVMRGSGQTIVPLCTTIVGFIAVRVPSAYILNHFFGMDTIFYAYAIGWVASLTTSGLFFLSGRWKHMSLVMKGLGEENPP